MTRRLRSLAQLSLDLRMCGRVRRCRLVGDPGCDRARMVAPQWRTESREARPALAVQVNQARGRRSPKHTQRHLFREAKLSGNVTRVTHANA